MPKKMSPEAEQIIKSMRWGELGFVPSFKDTDKTLMKAALKTYNNLNPDKKI